MGLPKDTAILHFRYSAWASARLVEAASKLSEEDLLRDHKTADKSVIGTLAHIFAADRIWHGRITGKMPAKFIDPENDFQLAVLSIAWPALYEKWIALLETADLNQLIHYKDLKGNPYTTPLWQIVLHAVNHATHHRGMIVAMIRSMGHTPPPVDLIFFYRQITPA